MQKVTSDQLSELSRSQTSKVVPVRGPRPFLQKLMLFPLMEEGQRSKNV